MLVLFGLLSCLPLGLFAHDLFGVRDDLHFSLEARQANKDGSVPTYKNAKASIEARINDLLPRMTLEEKVSQLIQGDINGWMDMSNPLDDTLVHNDTGLAQIMSTRAGSIWAGYQTPWEKLVYAITVGQKYLMENTTLGIPALFQSEGLYSKPCLHGFTDNGTIFPSPIGFAASFDRQLIHDIADVVAQEAEGLGINHIFAPVLDLARELRWGRVEEGLGECPYLTGELGYAYVHGLQDGSRRNTSSTAIARVAATCKHFAAFGTPQGGLNLAQVSGGERELRTAYLRPFNRACVDALSIMTAYASYDGVPAVANSHLLTDILRNEWGYKYWVTCDAGSIDLQITMHGTCDTRECAAKTALESGLSGEMGGGTYTYETLVAQVKAGQVDVKYIDDTVRFLLRTKFSLGLFENPYPYADYLSTLRTPASQAVLQRADRETIVLLENKNNVLPLSKSIGSIALIGPQVNRVTFGDYVFFNASNNGISPLEGFRQHLTNISSSTKINFAQGAELWSNDQSGFPEAVQTAQNSDVAIVMVGTWSLDQTLLWTPGTNATTGEMRDQSDLGLAGAQLELVKAIQSTGKPTIVVYVTGKPIAEPWIKDNADAIVHQFYPGEYGGRALAEVIFGDVNPSGRLSVSVPRDVGTTPVFYNYLKGGRPSSNPGATLADGSLMFGNQYVLNSPQPLWSFGHGMSYTTFAYSGLTLSPSTVSHSAGTVKLSVTVANTGSRTGKEVVQVYATDDRSSIVTPNQELIGFAKVEIAPGKSTTVTMDIDVKDLSLWTKDNKWIVEPGTFTIKVGTSDQVFQNATLTVS
ncbi:glycoside hydrolase family 3 protein [Macrolepiota fuliginosa MF-IS2]|uniref:beta-glucosidase n=1 Tax=Macrolepiota fuliginosa MF-IS2 TaxID=1400762 RepID=A0A9P6C339_9AGAR|nr:glycoside hydrolase family 3 protein [Macrolepiota fuliginosa MF-IS2]